MKKILFLILIVFSLTSCRAANAIYYNLYFASIGIEYENDEYTCYFYLPSSLDLGNDKSNNEQKAEVAKSSGKTLQDVFNNIEASSFLIMNFKHISSLVLHEEIFKNKKLDDVIAFINSFKEIDKNFFIFTTSDKIDDVYKLKNMNNESLILTTLTEPKINQYIFSSSKPIHYLNFCRDYYNNKTIDLPYIEAKSIFSEEIDSIICKGVCFISRNNYLIYNSNNKFNYFNDNINISFYDQNINVIIEKYSTNYKYKNNRIIMDVDLEYKVLSSKIENTEEYIKKGINEIIINTFNDTSKIIDFLNSKYYEVDNILQLNIKAKKQ